MSIQNVKPVPTETELDAMYASYYRAAELRRIRTNARHINRPVHPGMALRRFDIRRWRQKGTESNVTAEYHIFLLPGYSLNKR